MKYLILISCLFFSCRYDQHAAEGQAVHATLAASSAALVPPPITDAFLNPAGTTVAGRFNPDDGFIRAEQVAGSFGAFLQSFPLKPDGTKVYLHDGSEKYSQQFHAAVLDISTGKADLQQCADAVMRLRAEYLWANQRFEEIHFNFVNGFTADYARWRRGDRIWVEGNETGWKTGNGATPTRKAFDQYLRKVFMFANTASLEKELHPKALAAIEVGDVLIKGGFPGHAVLVVDKAVNPATGAVEVLLAQSYMPAQDIHILRNPNRSDGNPWYPVPANGSSFLTMEWRFAPGALRSFP